MINGEIGDIGEIHIGDIVKSGEHSSSLDRHVDF